MLLQNILSHGSKQYNTNLSFKLLKDDIELLVSWSNEWN